MPGAGVIENELPCQLAGTPVGTTTAKPVVRPAVAKPARTSAVAAVPPDGLPGENENPPLNAVSASTATTMTPIEIDMSRMVLFLRSATLPCCHAPGPVPRAKLFSPAVVSNIGVDEVEREDGPG